MYKPSSTVIHKYTRETITFVNRSIEELLIEVSLLPNTEGPPLHRHDRFTEKFTVIEGSLQLNTTEKNGFFA